MSAVVALRAARDAGIQIKIGGGDLLLEATTPPPSTVIDLLSRHKAEIVMLLRPADDGWSAEDWQVFFDERAGIVEFDGGVPRAEAEAQAFACCVAEWLNRNPAPSRAGHCAWCAERESQSACVLPFGTEPGTHTWLHSDCWPPWRKDRESKATDALRLMGVKPPSPPADPI
jgi:hypothetical protein